MFTQILLFSLTRKRILGSRDEPPVGDGRPGVRSLSPGAIKDASWASVHSLTPFRLLAASNTNL